MATRQRLDSSGAIDHIIEEKHCTGCGTWKPLRHFHRDSRRKDGYDPRCTSCRRATQAASYRRHAERRRATMREYYATFRTEILASQQAAYHADIETARAVKRLHGANRSPRTAA